MKCRRLSLVLSALTAGLICPTFFLRSNYTDRALDDSLIPFGTESIVARDYTSPQVRAIAEPDQDLFELAKGKDAIWLSTAPPHTRASYDLLPFRARSGREKSTSFELFLNTTGLGTPDRKRVFSEILDLTTLTNIYATLKEPFPAGTIDILQEVSVEYHRAGLMTRFVARPRNLTFSIDLPLIVSYNHIWLEASERERLIQLFTNTIGGGGGSFLSKDQTNKLIDLVLLKNPDVRLGDLHVTLEVTPLKTNSITASVGIEAAIPFVRPSSFSNRQTNLTYPQPVIDVNYLISDDLNQKLFQLLFDTLTVFQKTAIVPHGDALKTGVGGFATLNMGFLDNKADFWTQLRFQHLVGGTRYRLIPVYRKVLPNEFRVAISPVSILQCTVGTSYRWQAWQITVGYDFYLATRERISAVVIESKAREQLELSKAETPRVKQHKVFGELSYGSPSWQRETSISLGGDYTFSSVGTPREWSLAISVATRF